MMISIEKKFPCPRCNSKKIIDYGEIIECLDCNLEFYKVDIRVIKDKSSILSIQEKMGIIKALKDNE